MPEYTIQQRSPIIPPIGARLIGQWGWGVPNTEATVVRHTLRNGKAGFESVCIKGDWHQGEGLHDEADLSPIGWYLKDSAIADDVEIKQLIAMASEKREQEELAKRLAEETARHEKSVGEDIARRYIGATPALIIAILLQDQSDSMSDSFYGIEIDHVVLATSKHTRNLFPEMRRAAMRLPDLAGLQWEERRENWSMGGGFYLLQRGGHRYRGWQVRKMHIRACGIDTHILRSLSKRHCLDKLI